MREHDEVRNRAALRRDTSLAPAGKVSGYEPGPTAATLRDPAVPFRWAGLSSNDAELLERFLRTMPRPPDELHTHVPVGRLPVVHEDQDDPDTAKLLATLWPRRIDVMARWGDDWYLIECKPDAAHYVVGQVLCYYFWLLRERPDLASPTPVVLTDKADEDVLPVLEALGIVVVELGPRGSGVELVDGLA
ncbi:hypothetical protein LCGC14_1041510 [marine sediment metagenome]|uniref:Uncharacterized protein n=1 Tax=marine sediment metagenome TaxID=412755 RepID=A0A0F9QXS5_9ZZZZ